MPRKPRWMQLVRDAGYHVMARGHTREAVFADPQDTRAFLGLLDRYRQRFGVRLYHYCLMTNHFHLLLQLDDCRRLSALMAGLLLVYARHCNRKHGFVGHLWKGRFKSPVIQREGYWLSCGRYIERNPVEAGLASEPLSYPWSSCRAYVQGEFDPLLTEDPCYNQLSPDPQCRRELWRGFLLGEDEQEAAIRQGDRAVGDDSFREPMAQVLGRPVARRRGRLRKQQKVEG